ncbi:MAG: hypothetical protein ACLTBR_03005 [Anaerostipes sp.]|uniref:hypothetical protein n=1 Tax=Anaerostipes sp. TaxID=1872530 RepID=UPI003992EB17
MTVQELKSYIYKNNKIETILSAIGCDYIVYHKKKEYYSCCQPDGDNKQGVNIKNNEHLNYRSYTRGVDYSDRQDLISLVQTSKKYTFIDTVKYLHKLLGLKLEYKKPSKKENKQKDLLDVFKRVRDRHREVCDVSEIQYINEDVLDEFVPYIHIGWFREGIIKKTIDAFGLAYSYRRKRNVVPLRYWMNGQLLGFNMRTTVENYDDLDISKYFITPGYPKDLNLFGLWENMETIKQKRIVVVFESEKSVLKRHSRLDGTGVAVGGHNISYEQARILTGLNCEIVIAFDKDISINQIRTCCEKFYGIRPVSYIYDNDDLIGEKDSPADALDEIYHKLFTNRTKYSKKEHLKYLKSLGKA